MSAVPVTTEEILRLLSNHAVATVVLLAELCRCDCWRHRIATLASLRAAWLTASALTAHFHINHIQPSKGDNNR